jgi:energy-coupling factor transporter transmembrane protein EcfT
MTRWIRSHPYTTALPFVMTTMTAVLKVISGRPWWECASFVLGFWALAFFNVWYKHRS